MGIMSSSVTHEWTLINGFAVEGNEETLAMVLSHPDVERVEEEGIAYANTLVTQTETVWGLGRLSSDTTFDGYWYYNYNYTYDDSAGEGVDVYMLDTGVYIDHPDFEGRAVWGATFPSTLSDEDENGHGTHTAGTVASATYGVAKKARIYAVKVLGLNGGMWADIIDGMDWVAANARGTGRPSVASMSFGGNGQQIVDDAVEALVASGVHVAVSAGNSGVDVNQTSPARAPSANTVGATTVFDELAWYSNYGAGIDILAPGTDVTSLYIGSPDATATLTGTSTASPHISGLIAYIIGLEGNMSPAAMTEKLKAMAQNGLITKVPSSTVNLFAHNQI